MLSSSREQGNFRGLEASRPRTSKCVLEAKHFKNLLRSAKNVAFLGLRILFKSVAIALIAVP